MICENLFLLLFTLYLAIFFPSSLLVTFCFLFSYCCCSIHAFLFVSANGNRLYIWNGLHLWYVYFLRIFFSIFSQKNPKKQFFSCTSVLTIFYYCWWNIRFYIKEKFELKKNFYTKWHLHRFNFANEWMKVWNTSFCFFSLLECIEETVIKTIWYYCGCVIIVRLMFKIQLTFERSIKVYQRENTVIIASMPGKLLLYFNLLNVLRVCFYFKYTKKYMKMSHIH